MTDHTHPEPIRLPIHFSDGTIQVGYYVELPALEGERINSMEARIAALEGSNNCRLTEILDCHKRIAVLEKRALLLPDAEKLSRDMDRGFEARCLLPSQPAAPDAAGANKVIEQLKADIAAMTDERDHYRKAKAENDERFMTERDAARAEADALRASRDKLAGLLRDVVDAEGDIHPSWRSELRNRIDAALAGSAATGR